VRCIDSSNLPMLLTQKEAAEVAGIPYSSMRKAFLEEGKRPKYVKFPPPHTYLGRSPRIFSERLSAWVHSLGDCGNIRRRGRPPNRSIKAAA